MIRALVPALLFGVLVAAPAAAQDFGGEVRAGWRWAQRNGRKGADDVTDLRSDWLVALRADGLGHEGVNAALTLRTETDLDGLDSDTDPFRDLTNRRNRSSVGELVRAWIEVGYLRVGRQSVRAAGHTWRFDGVRLHGRAAVGFALTAFGGRRAATFASPDDDWLAGGVLQGRPWPGGHVRAGWVEHRGGVGTLALRQEVGFDTTAEVGWTLRDGRHDTLQLRLDFLPETWPVEASFLWRRRTGRSDEVDVLDPTGGEPGQPPDRDAQYLALDALAPHDRIAIEALWQAGAGLEFEGRVAHRRLLDRDRQTVYDWMGWEWLLGARWRHRRDGGVEAALEWSRGAVRAPSFDPHPEFVNPNAEGVRAFDDVTASVGWSWRASRDTTGNLDRFAVRAGVSWYRLDYRSEQRQMRDLNELALDLSVTVGWVTGLWVRVGYAYEDDFALLDDETADLHYARVELGWRF